MKKATKVKLEHLEVTSFITQVTPNTLRGGQEPAVPGEKPATHVCTHTGPCV